MAGLVIGSLVAFFKQRRSQLGKFPPPQILQRFAAALAVSIPAVFVLLSVVPLDHVRMLWEKIQVAYFVFFILLCTIPFFLYGILISFALSMWRDKANKVYANDLMGGAAGLLLVVMLLNLLRIEYVLVILTVATGFVILLALKRKLSQIVIGSLLFGLCLFIVLDASVIKMSPYKGLVQALKDDGARHVTTLHSSHSRLDLFENTRMKYAPGLSLAFKEAVPQGLGMALDGEIAGVIMGRNEQRTYNFLSYVPSALPYLLLQPENVVIIGVRNSIDLLQPNFFGVSQISMAEHDASVVKAFALYHDRVGFRSMPLFFGSGRILLKKLPQGLGLIFLSRTGFFPSGNFGLQEDYDLTVEAITTYIERLKDNGILFIQMFLVPPPRTDLRLAKSIRTALKKTGIHELGKYLLIYRSWDTVNFLVKKDGFSEADFSRVSQFLASRQFDLLYPDIVGQEKFISGLDYQTLFNKVLADELSVGFSSSYIFDIRETTDDRPFFHYFLKPSKIGEVFKISGGKWPYFIHEGMFLPFVLIFLIFIAICVFGSALLLSKKLPPRLAAPNIQPPTGFLIYFALVGFAFMFIEVFFIHRLILPFGSPMKAFSITLVTTLMSAGIGSLTSRWFVGRKMTWIICLAPLFIISTYFFFDLADETALSVVFMVPIGIVLGLFFPIGLRFLVSEKAGEVPLAYAANGAASIIAPSLASLVAVSYGCNVLLILAAILYTLAIAIMLFAVHRKSSISKYS